jgi:aminodeoxyfutalosine synthase
MATEIAQTDGSADLLLKVLSGERLSGSDCLRLWKTRDLTSLGALANLRREAASGNAVFFRREVHRNYTGLPVPSCPLCNRFPSQPLSPGEWERSLEHIPPDVVAELHLTAGASPQFGLEALCTIVRTAVTLRPNLKIRAFTWSELETAAEREGATPDQTLAALVEAGLNSLAGGALMDLRPDRPHLVRECIAQLELRAPWVAAAAARGLRCEISWVYGGEDDPQSVIDGLARIGASFSALRRSSSSGRPVMWKSPWPQATISSAP